MTNFNKLEAESVANKGQDVAAGASQALYNAAYDGKPHTQMPQPANPHLERLQADLAAGEVTALGRDVFMKLSGGDGILTDADIRTFLRSNSLESPIPISATKVMQDLLRSMGNLDERNISDKVQGMLPQVTFDGLVQRAHEIRPQPAEQIKPRTPKF